MFQFQGQQGNFRQSIKSNKYNKEYFLLELIGQGTEGKVYKGEEITNNGKEFVAIKVSQILNQQNIIQRFAEKKFINLINVREVITNIQGNYIIMDYADGEFYKYMQSDEYKQKSLNEKHDLFIQIVQGVEELHDMKMIHRDLKPENILYFKQQNNGILLKLCDFGLIKYNSENLQKTANIGTPYYWAPEMLSQQSYVNYTEKIDIWALGMIWYEMIIGKPMLINLQTSQMIKDHLQKGDQNWINEQIDKVFQFLPKEKEILKTSIIVIDQNKRITAKQLKETLIEIKNQQNQINNPQQQPFPNSQLQNFQQLNNLNQLKLNLNIQPNQLIPNQSFCPPNQQSKLYQHKIPASPLNQDQKIQNNFQQNMIQKPIQFNLPNQYNGNIQYQNQQNQNIQLQNQSTIPTPETVLQNSVQQQLSITSQTKNYKNIEIQVELPNKIEELQIQLDTQIKLSQEKEEQLISENQKLKQQILDFQEQQDKNNAKDKTLMETKFIQEILEKKQINEALAQELQKEQEENNNLKQIIISKDSDLTNFKLLEKNYLEKFQNYQQSLIKLEKETKGLSQQIIQLNGILNNKQRDLQQMNQKLFEEQNNSRTVYQEKIKQNETFCEERAKFQQLLLSKDQEKMSLIQQHNQENLEYQNKKQEYFHEKKTTLDLLVNIGLQILQFFHFQTQNEQQNIRSLDLNSDIKQKYFDNVQKLSKIYQESKAEIQAIRAKLFIIQVEDQDQIIKNFHIVQQNIQHIIDQMNQYYSEKQSYYHQIYLNDKDQLNNLNQIQQRFKELSTQIVQKSWEQIQKQDLKQFFLLTQEYQQNFYQAIQSYCSQQPQQIMSQINDINQKVKQICDQIDKNIIQQTSKLQQLEENEEQWVESYISLDNTLKELQQQNQKLTLLLANFPKTLYYLEQNLNQIQERTMKFQEKEALNIQHAYATKNKSKKQNFNMFPESMLWFQEILLYISQIQSCLTTLKQQQNQEQTGSLNNLISQIQTKLNLIKNPTRVMLNSSKNFDQVNYYPQPK